jgi:hypothetical protein
MCRDSAVGNVALTGRPTCHFVSPTKWPERIESCRSGEHEWFQSQDCLENVDACEDRVVASAVLGKLLSNGLLARILNRPGYRGQ